MLVDTRQKCQGNSEAVTDDSTVATVLESLAAVSWSLHMHYRKIRIPILIFDFIVIQDRKHFNYRCECLPVESRTLDFDMLFVQHSSFANVICCLAVEFSSRVCC